MDFKGKCALVTGGASGIGFQCVKELLNQGISKCAILDINTNVGEESCQILSNEFGKECVMFVKCDVTDMLEFEAAVKKVVAIFKQLDILINNAGYLNETTWEKILQTNLQGVINGSMIGIRFMGTGHGGQGGTIVNMASIAGLNPEGCAPVYSATKAGVIAYSRAMAAPYHFRQTGVRFLVMCPGVTTTQMLENAKTMYLDEELKKETEKSASAVEIQGPEHVAKAMSTLLQIGSNGSVWVSEENKPIYQVDF